MKIRISKCRMGFIENKPVVMFEVNRHDFDRFKVNDGKLMSGYVADIYKPKRSSQANRYMWELIGEIATKAGLRPVDVYKQAIREAGVWYDGEVPTKDFADFCDDWSAQGIGWWVEQDIRGTKKTSFRAYRGSSQYNSKQMSRLIDYIVDEAQFWDIETDTPEQIARIKALWGEEHGEKL